MSLIELYKRKFVKDSVFLSSASYLNQFFHFIRGFIIARLLDPELFGYLSGVRLVLIFTSQMHFGALHGMTRGLSLYKGTNDIENYQRDKNNGIGSITIFSAFIVLGIITYTFFVKDIYNPYVIWGIRVFAIVAFITQMISINHALLRVEYRFTEISKSEIVLGFSSLVLAIIFVPIIGLYGAILSYLLATMLSFVYLIRKTKLDFRFEFNKNITKKLLLVGAPISLFFFNRTILAGLDKLMIINFLEVKQLGCYSIAFPFFALLTKIPHSISYIVYPKMLDVYGSSNKEIRTTKRYFQIPTQFNAFLIAYFIGMLILTIKYIFIYLLPLYVEAIPVARILLFATFFNIVSMIAIRVLITQMSYRILFLFQGIAVLVNIILNYTLIKMGYGIIGVAVATGISYFIYSFLVLHRTLYQFYDGWFNVLLHQLKLYQPILYVGIILIVMSVVNFFHVDEIRSLSSDMFLLTFNLLVFSLLTIPLFIFVNRRMIKQFR